ncbi:hypothetical protein GW17_00010244 [Ensete ventricosum]|nr:hypothetical protein GW17_00010244 [Ensete ventricosum]
MGIIWDPPHESHGIGWRRRWSRSIWGYGNTGHGTPCDDTDRCRPSKTTDKDRRNRFPPFKRKRPRRKRSGRRRHPNPAEPREDQAKPHTPNPHPHQAEPSRVVDDGFPFYPPPKYKSSFSLAMEESGDHKRRRGEDEGDGFPEISSPEAKRIRENLLLDDILDDDSGAGDQDLASVMKSLEDEIALPSPPPQPQSVVAIDQPDLGYLFEASDDELGLPPPPPAPSMSDEPPEAEVAVAPGVGGEMDGVGFGQIWGFDDEINGYGWLDEFGIRPEERAEAELNGVVFDGGLFDYADLPWRSETLPAL